MPERLQHPGPSYLKEVVVQVGDRRLAAGMAKPQAGPDDWWMAVLWVADDEAVVSFREAAPAAGPRPEPPLHHLGPAFAGNLSGMILEEDGRLCIRLVPLVPPEDDTRPWRCAIALRTAFKWEPALVATMTPNQLASRVLAAFGRAVESLHRA